MRTSLFVTSFVLALCASAGAQTPPQAAKPAPAPQPPASAKPAPPSQTPPAATPAAPQTPPAAPAAPTAEAPAQGAQPPQAEAYTYRPEGRRDPFQTLIGVGSNSVATSITGGCIGSTRSGQR